MYISTAQPPRVYAMILLDQNRSYAHISPKTSKPVTIAESLPPSSRSIDRKVFREFLHQFDDTPHAFAVGANTWSDLGQQIRDRILENHTVFVSSASEILKVTKTTTEQVCQMSGEARFIKCGTLSNVVTSFCHENGSRLTPMGIVVLGGKSVYMSFAGQYTDVFVCRGQTSEVGTFLQFPPFRSVFLRPVPWPSQDDFEDAYYPKKQDPDENDQLTFMTEYHSNVSIRKTSTFDIVGHPVKTMLYTVTHYQRGEENEQ